MSQALIGTAGFLAAVLWMDLMFDVEAMGHDGTLPDQVLDFIAAYYHHVTTAAAPMGNLISLVMLLAVLGAVLQLSQSVLPLWLRAAALVTVLVPTVLALTYIVPAAVRLGARADTLEVQSDLARAILSGHVVCLASILVFLTLQILAVQRLRRSGPRGLPA